MCRIGVIGGSGLENPQFFEKSGEKLPDTPYGRISSPISEGKIEGAEVAILSRHGREHTIPPTYVNNRANIHALKDLGCTHIIATTAVGSLREKIGRGDLVILDQFIDFTRKRALSFHDQFEPGNPVHTPMPDPFDGNLRNLLKQSAEELQIRFHEKGTVVTIEGPRFSTRAESHMFRQWGADVINMSIAPEAILANEAGVPYAAVAMSTDYDCWKEDEAPVSWDAILEIFSQNVEKVIQLIRKTIPKI